MLELSFSRAYHLAMTFDFLLRAVARLLPAKKQPGADCSQDIEDDKTWDAENPFPDVVVIEFGDVLDLHSIPPRQVPAVVKDYLAEAHRRSVRALRIVHGKGVGVQREIVRSILASLPYVIEYRDAPAEAGGWGATLVTLGTSGPLDETLSLNPEGTERQV